MNEELLCSLASSLSHRGPDGEGTMRELAGADRLVGFAHRRLSIIDLSESGNQPMRDPDTGNWITFNGEIYNYREIRRNLEARGIVFESQSDTEVILKAYEMYGTACLDHLRGMFSFALWDNEKQRLFGAVDRFGIKPLYYAKRPGLFAFSSEIKSLLSSGLVSKTINRKAVTSFFAFGSVQAPETIIEGVESLLPAHAFVYCPEKNHLRTFQYWSPYLWGESTTNLDDVRESILDSVRTHLVSDVPLGLFLSGGVDSSALAVLARSEGADLHAFNVTFNESDFAEAKYARQIGERYCSKYTELVVSQEDVKRQIPEVLRAMDQPTIDGVNAYVISKAVRASGIKAVLSGQGGDEVFGGYESFRRIPRALPFAKLLAQLPGSVRNNISSIAKIYLHGVSGSKTDQFVSGKHDLLSLYNLSRQLFNEEVIDDLLPGVSKLDFASGRTRSTAEWFKKEIAPLDPWSAVSWLEMRGYLAGTLLRDGDVMSMAHGLEVRVPYVDHQLVETVFRLPTRFKRHSHLPKPALLKTVIDQLPQEIYARQKMGFTFPWELWLRADLRADIENAFNDVAAADQLGLSLPTVREIWKGFCDHRSVSWSRVWAPYVLLKWVREHIL